MSRGWLMVRMLLAVLLAGTVQAGEPSGTGLDPVALERLVLQDCGSCHGLTLKGGLGPDIRPESLVHYEADVLMSVILDGIPGTAMPPWRPLITEDEAAWIADYLLQVETK